MVCCSCVLLVVRLLTPCEGPSLTLRSWNWCRSARRSPLKMPCGAKCLRVLWRKKNMCRRDWQRLWVHAVCKHFVLLRTMWSCDQILFIVCSYPDRGGHILEDSWGPSAPRRIYRCPYSTWRLAGSLLPGCSRETCIITEWKVNSNRQTYGDGWNKDRVIVKPLALHHDFNISLHSFFETFCIGA